jgi:hypothetical protein
VRLLCLEHFRNLIETQALDSGTTVYTDHAPFTYVGSLSNKGRLSTWRIHDTSDLTGIVQTLYKAGQYLGPGPYGGLADPLSSMPRGEQFHLLELPALSTELLQRLPDSVRTAHNIRVTAEKDTHLATRIVQRWWVPKNPISNVRSDNKEEEGNTVRGEGNTQGGTTYPRKEEVCGPHGRGPTASDKSHQSKGE